jgi:glycosyltransferase involved in cell wall biosynthesis
MNLEQQVTVLNKAVDVDRILAGVHASITLAAAPDIVKSYPHSLLESLAAGKPVLISRAIPMADYVEQRGCGKVVESISLTDILTAIEALTKAYGGLQKSAEQAGKSDFSKERLIASFREVYHRVSAGNIDQEWGCY